MLHSQCGPFKSPLIQPGVNESLTKAKTQTHTEHQGLHTLTYSMETKDETHTHRMRSPLSTEKHLCQPAMTSKHVYLYMVTILKHADTNRKREPEGQVYSPRKVISSGLCFISLNSLTFQHATAMCVRSTATDLTPPHQPLHGHHTHTHTHTQPHTKICAGLSFT